MSPGPEVRFVWDVAKAASNVAKHGITFEEARSVFYDGHAIRTFDPFHSEDEDRWIIIGCVRTRTCAGGCPHFPGQLHPHHQRASGQEAGDR